MKDEMKERALKFFTDDPDILMVRPVGLDNTESELEYQVRICAAFAALNATIEWHTDDPCDMCDFCDSLDAILNPKNAADADDGGK